uniref:TraR/DksA C4-type zinc finger protein n=1 Tax=Escherichia coli TaxID=562 RepID=UPI00196AF521|nr:TraR/DksA C4-type zinc finger protein [Escherichia coli]
MHFQNYWQVCWIVSGIPVYLCEACGNPIPEARRKIFPGVTLCVECQAYQERQRKHYA